MGGTTFCNLVPKRLEGRQAGDKSESRETRFGVQPAQKETDLDYLDIPAFLRRQAN